ncbi:hypothetical protein EYR41_009084 [Orbilia oligospora]|uniref:Uncharacterized protein n=1 Tax=Orbilia oligospora TaxID=2813651 RepID=A0A7C8KI25_ORBOL|nr:hypothetical protein TWF751_007377 [Orbilia oligospora]TGJ65084.1 hypothetical protein EYR41_009084 [Orbilia oligospora]
MERASLWCPRNLLGPLVRPTIGHEIYRLLRHVLFQETLPRQIFQDFLAPVGTALPIPVKIVPVPPVFYENVYNSFDCEPLSQHPVLFFLNNSFFVIVVVAVVAVVSAVSVTLL